MTFGFWKNVFGIAVKALFLIFIFEKELDRRLTRTRDRGSPRTLEELVRELRDAELNSNWKLSRQYDTSDSPRGFWRGVQRLDDHDGDQFRLENEPTEKDVIGTPEDV